MEEVMPFLPSLSEILNVMKSKNYRVYEGNNPSNRSFNIVGIRNKALSPDKFDDTLAIFHLIPGATDLLMFPITTDPSPYYLKNPVNSKGTAVLKEDQYVDTYAISQHSPPSGNKHQAVCQRLAKVTVFRDGDKDGKLNFKSPDLGMHGINIHRGPSNGDWDSKNKNYSAGCQVFADADDFNIFMSRARDERKNVGNVFTYTLLNQKDFE